MSAIWARPVTGARGDKLDDVVPGGRACGYTMSPGNLDVLIKPAGSTDTLTADTGDVALPHFGESAVFFDNRTLAVLWDGYNYAISDEGMVLDDATRLEKLASTASKLHEGLG